MEGTNKDTAGGPGYDIRKREKDHGCDGYDVYTLFIRRHRGTRDPQSGVSPAH